VLVAGQLLGKAPSPGFEIATSDPSASAGDEKPAKSASEDESGTVQFQRFPIDLTEAFPPPPAGSPAAQALSRKINLLWGKIFVDVRRTPMLGNPDADVVLFELFDYTCPHCRQLHRYLKEARDRYGSQLAVAVLVTPMSPDCNRYVHEPPALSGRATCDLARLSLAVWQAKPEAFESFHDWLLDSAEIPSLEAARGRAAEIVGPEGLEQALASPAVARQLEADNRLYHVSGEGTIPKLLANRMTITGEPESAAALFGVLEALGLSAR
jgi:protein-disulfide isomerase